VLSLSTSDEPRPLRLGFARAAARFLPPGVSRRLTEVLYPASEGRRHDYIAVTKSITGSTFRGRTSDYYGHQFSVTGYFAWKNYAVARAVCAPGSTVIEVGANVGTETLAYSDVVGSSGHVYAIEPVPGNQESLRALIRLNGWANVTIIPVALGSRRRTARFSLPPPNNSGTGYLMPTDEAGLGRSIQVQCVTLDSLEQLIGPAEIVFSDTEGAELDVLRGATEYLLRHRPVYVVEVVPRWLARAGVEPKELLDEFTSLGYRPFLLGWFGLRPIRRENVDVTGDWVAIPRDRDILVKRISRYVLRSGLLPPVRGLNPLAGLGSRAG
jgi:FkbM family methyltransferase